MRTTIRLDDALLAEVRQEASQRGETFTALVEQGLRLLLTQWRQRPRRSRVILPVCNAGGGTMPGVDLNDSAALLDLLDDRL